MLLIVLFSFAFCANDDDDDDNDNVEVTLLADVPYNLAEKEELEDAIPHITSDFIVHLGDITRMPVPDVPCEEDLYSDISQLLKLSEVPVFMIPGDNEWVDCVNSEQAWEFWTHYFIRFDLQFSHTYTVTQQANHEENFVFTYQDIIFIGLNLVPLYAGDVDLKALVFEEALHWSGQQLSEADESIFIAVIFAHPRPNAFITGLTEDIKDFGRPVLYVHGDTHKFFHKREYKGIKTLDLLSLPRGSTKLYLSDSFDTDYSYELQAKP